MQTKNLIMINAAGQVLPVLIPATGTLLTALQHGEGVFAHSDGVIAMAHENRAAIVDQEGGIAMYGWASPEYQVDLALKYGW